MQDGYVGDVGDFGKYGLLRWLCRADRHGGVLRLGVLWYRVDQGKTPGSGDGSHTEYIFQPSQQERLLRECDPDLFEKMRNLVVNERTVEAVEASGVLPADTLFFSMVLDFEGTTPAERRSKRRSWCDSGLARVAKVDVVFADPDNGLEIPTCDRFSLRGPKYAYYNDILPCWQRGQSLIIYQHMSRTYEGRKAPAEEQIAQRCQELRRRLPGANPIALRFRRRSSRVYFVLAQPQHSARLQARVAAFLASSWSHAAPPHFEGVCATT